MRKTLDKLRKAITRSLLLISLSLNFMILTYDSAYFALSKALAAFTGQQVLAITQAEQLVELRALTQTLELDNHKLTLAFASLERDYERRLFQIKKLETELRVMESAVK
jgi:hypothetical protein